jgi:hypothetical protein
VVVLNGHHAPRRTSKTDHLASGPVGESGLSVPLLVGERVATNGELHLLGRIRHHGPDALRVRVVRDLAFDRAVRGLPARGELPGTITTES